MKEVGLLLALLSGGSVAVTGDAKIVGFDGVERTGSIGDLDTIVARSRTTLSDAGWTAVLAPETTATLRTECRGESFARVLDLASGSLSLSGAWEVRAGGFLISAQNAGVEVSFHKGILTVAAGSGDVIQIVGKEAVIHIAGGQQVKVSYDPKTGSFTAEVLEDKGKPIDLKLGKTYFTVDKGDKFNAAVNGDDFDVEVLNGDVTIMGPGMQPTIAGKGTKSKVAGGAKGAVGPRDYPRRRVQRGKHFTVCPYCGGNHRKHVYLPSRPFRDRTDVSPS
jgi:hypothetical protein